MTINFHFKHVFLSEDPWILLVSFTMYRIRRPNSEKILKGEKSFAIYFPPKVVPGRLPTTSNCMVIITFAIFYKADDY